jgi:N-acetylneuraminic acid mutarotase
MLVAKCKLGVCVLDGLIYLIGGKDLHYIDVKSVHRFDPVENLWSKVVPLTVPRSSFGVCVLDGSIYVVGGWCGEGRLTSMERYFVASDSWSE